MIDILEGVTRKLQRNAQWKGTMALAAVKEGLFVKPVAGAADEFTVGEAAGTDTNLYLTVVNGDRGDVEIAGLSVVGGPEGFSFRIYNDNAYAQDLFVDGAPAVQSEDPIWVGAANALAKPTVALSLIQFKVERVGADNIVLVYTPGGFGVV